MLNTDNYYRNANQNYEISPHASQNGHQQNLQTINAGKVVEERELSYNVSGNVNRDNHYRKQCGSSLKN